MYNDEALVELSRQDFWDNRYGTEAKEKKDEGQEVYEWFRSFEQIRSFLEKYLPSPNTETAKECKILHLGCGDSNLTAEMHTLGYRNQTSVDFSQVVIDLMKTKHAELQTTWQVMDVRDLKFDDNSIDFAIDKATLDAMIHGSLWDPPADVRENVGKYAEEVARVLKPGAKWLYITYRQPHFIKILLDRKELWDFQYEEIADPQGAGGFGYFGFVMTKH